MKATLVTLIVVVGAALLLMIFLGSSEPNWNNISDKEVKERIGQMLVVGFRGTEASADSYVGRLISDLNIGGVILFDFDIPSNSFPRNIVSPEQTKRLVARLQSHSPAPLFVAVDAEGGRINRLKEGYGFIVIPSHQELGAKDSTDQTRVTAAALAKQLKEIGFNLNFAPVVDLNLNPANPIIGLLGRSFSESPEEVTNHARVFIEEHREQGVITALKHFPGHGSSAGDTHKGLVDITKAYKPEELAPFKNLIDQGLADMVMIAHLTNRNVDPDYPATLSARFVQDILRGELGYKGVVISDDVQMGAIESEYGFAEALVRAVNAGVDIVLVSNNADEYDESAPYRASEVIFTAVKGGIIPLERIVESSNRVLSLKKGLK